jgi:hypothetical protein
MKKEIKSVKKSETIVFKINYLFFFNKFIYLIKYIIRI